MAAHSPDRWRAICCGGLEHGKRDQFRAGPQRSPDEWVGPLGRATSRRLTGQAAEDERRYADRAADAVIKYGYGLRPDSGPAPTKAGRETQQKRVERLVNQASSRWNGKERCLEEELRILERLRELVARLEERAAAEGRI